MSDSTTTGNVIPCPRCRRGEPCADNDRIQVDDRRLDAVGAYLAPGVACPDPAAHDPARFTRCHDVDAFYRDDTDLAPLPAYGDADMARVTARMVDGEPRIDVTPIPRQPAPLPAEVADAVRVLRDGPGGPGQFACAEELAEAYDACADALAAWATAHAEAIRNAEAVTLRERDRILAAIRARDERDRRLAELIDDVRANWLDVLTEYNDGHGLDGYARPRLETAIGELCLLAAAELDGGDGAT